MLAGTSKQPGFMSSGLKWFVSVISVILIALVVLFVLIRFHDGPMEILAGGPFKSGELVTEVTDWSFMDEFLTVEMQTMQPPRSRTMWVVVYDNRLYVISSYMKTGVGRLWKRWPRQLDEDNRAVIRADGKLYELQLVRVPEDDEVIAGVVERFNEKYNTPYTAEVVTSGNTWLFELAWR